MSQSYTLLIGIGITLIFYTLRELNVIKNRWLLLFLLLVGLGMLNFSIYQSLVAPFSWLVGGAVSIASITFFVMAIGVAFPQFNLWRERESIISWVNRVLFSLAAALMLFAMIWDTARPSFPAIAWRTIASLWAFATVILYINYSRRQRHGQSAPEQVSEHVIKHVQAVAEQLRQLTAGAYSCSLKQIFGDILNNSTFNKWYKDEPLMVDLTSLFDKKLNSLFDRLPKLEEKTKHINIKDIPTLYNEITTFNSDYRSAVNEFIRLLNNFKAKGAPTIWENEPLSGKIYRDLRDGYDELMRLLKELRVYSTDMTKPLLPRDDQLTKFDRIPGVV